MHYLVKETLLKHKQRHFFPWEERGLLHHQLLPGRLQKSQTGLSSRQEPDSRMHRSESGSGSQAGEGAGSSSEASHGQREWAPCDPPALNWVWHLWHGIPRWSVSGVISFGVDTVCKICSQLQKNAVT